MRQAASLTQNSLNWVSTSLNHGLVPLSPSGRLPVATGASPWKLTQQYPRARAAGDCRAGEVQSPAARALPIGGADTTGSRPWLLAVVPASRDSRTAVVAS